MQQAIELADEFAQQQVGWFEEPVSSDDLNGLRAMRDRAPAGMEIAAGEYAYTVDYVRSMLEARAVDVQQADVTRCGGITEFLRIAGVARAASRELSGHCAPHLHAAAMAAIPNARHIEWFHDHVRIESMLLSGTVGADGGELRPDLTAPGHGLTIKDSDAQPYRIG